MATAQQLWDDKVAKVAAKQTADAAVDSDKAAAKLAADAAAAKLAADTAAAQQAATDEAIAEAAILAKFPEGQAFVFGTVTVAKLHGEIVELPVTDPGTDLG